MMPVVSLFSAGDGTVSAIPAQPSKYHDWVGGQWIDARSPLQVDQDAIKDRAEKVAAIKAEANRRILAIVPEWKQRNLTAQAAQLAEKGRAAWTAEELAAWNAGLAVWAQVAAIRAASDVIEAMEALPDDITDPALWP